MASVQFVSYVRVSTSRQHESGLGEEAQRAAVNRFLTAGNGECSLIQEIVEVESGKRSDRPKLAEALRLCRIHNAVLCVAKLDRLARNVHFISSLMESGVRFIALDSPQANDMTLHILASVAQGEAKAISDRTKVALAALKARGVELGGMRSNSGSIHLSGTPKSVTARKLKAAKRATDINKTIELLKAEGATSLRDIAAKLNEKNVPTARGGKWSAIQVQRVMGTAKA